MTVAGALADLADRGINAVPVQSLRELVDRHRVDPTITVNFEKRERDGWETECFAPSWFAFDGVPGARPAAEVKASTYLENNLDHPIGPSSTRCRVCTACPFRLHRAGWDSVPRGVRKRPRR